jgi:hypothetical protein
MDVGSGEDHLSAFDGIAPGADRRPLVRCLPLDGPLGRLRVHVRGQTRSRVAGDVIGLRSGLASAGTQAWAKERFPQRLGDGANAADRCEEA